MAALTLRARLSQGLQSLKGHVHRMNVLMLCSSCVSMVECKEMHHKKELKLKVW